MSGDVRDAGLYSRYVAFIRAALTLVREHQNGQPAPTRLRTKVRRQDARTTQIEGEQEPDIFFLLVPYFDALKSLTEFESLHAYILSSPLADHVFVDAGNKPIEQAESQSWWLMNFYVVPLLTRYIGPELVLDFEEGRARSVYAGFEAFLESTQVTYSIVAPLEWFEGPDEEVRLNATTVLRKLSEGEIQYLWHLGEFGGIVDRHQALGMSFCLETTQVAEKNAPVDFSEVYVDLIRVVTALRLLKSGQVGIPVVTQRSCGPAFGPGGSTATSGPSPASMGPRYVLTLGERGDLLSVYEALTQGTVPKQLKVALDRFNYAYNRTRPDDRLIDYWIALEALFLPDEPPQELRYRASLRVAYFVSQGPEEREETFTQIRRSYDVRSAIVHGRESEDAPQIAQFTEDVLRRALRRAVVAPESLDTQQLDKLILRGS